MTLSLRSAGVILALLFIISTSHATFIPSCSHFFGSPSAPGCYHLVWSGGSVPQDWIRRFFLNYGTARPPSVPVRAWSRRVFLPVLRENAGCKLALLPIREANGVPAATIDTWSNIARAAASDRVYSVYKNCLLPHSVGVGGYRSTGLNWKLVIVLYEPGSLFDQEVRANVTEGVPIVAERVHFGTAYYSSPHLQAASEGNSTVEALSIGTS